MVNEIGYPWKMPCAAAPMLALAQLIILNGHRPGFWVCIGERVRQARDGPVQEKEERYERQHRDPCHDDRKYHAHSGIGEMRQPGRYPARGGSHERAEHRVDDRSPDGK